MAAALSTAWRALRRFASAHHRGLAATALAALAVVGVGAFAIAPMAPDAALLPQRLISETVTPEPVDGQLDALAGARLTLSRSTRTDAGDTADSLLRRLGAADPEAVRWLRSDPTAQRLFNGRPGKMVSATLSGQGQLLTLVARFPAQGETDATPTHFTRLTLSRADGPAWRSAVEELPLAVTTRVASGSIRSSLFAATDEANIPDPIAVQLADIFSSDIDFHHALRSGDSFSVVYEALTADGEPITWNQASGRVLAAEFVNDGHAYNAVWFDGNKGGYYDFNGQSLHRAFLASPMRFSRVTSGFAMRFHPILKKWKAHLGVDYGAPIGTPVRVVGDGVVSFAGQQTGYGNVIQVQHSGDRMTVYAHLSRIDVRRGEHVSQGENIGAVGETGWATGPHLHFEFRLHGQQLDPLVVAKSAETVALASADRPRFALQAQQLKSALDVAESVHGLAGRIE